jgi:hypothetical protein
MTKYRKKPAVIEAMQYTGFIESKERCTEWIGKDCQGGNQYQDKSEKFVIHTLEGDMTVQPNDFIIKGVKGEFYPCKPDIFEATYELVKE